jgi:hypothetical protein
MDRDSCDVWANQGGSQVITFAGCISYLYFSNDPNWLFGPPEVRKLLALRGFIGYVLFAYQLRRRLNLGHFRFFGLTGMYQSLRYLTLNDATALGFLSPTVTALLGSALLKEHFSRREAIAGSTFPLSLDVLKLTIRSSGIPTRCHHDRSANIHLRRCRLPLDGSSRLTRRRRWRLSHELGEYPDTWRRKGRAHAGAESAGGHVRVDGRLRK